MLVTLVVVSRRAAAATTAAEAVHYASADAFCDTPEDGEGDDATKDDAYDYWPFAARDGQSLSS